MPKLTAEHGGSQSQAAAAFSLLPPVISGQSGQDLVDGQCVAFNVNCISLPQASLKKGESGSEKSK